MLLGMSVSFLSGTLGLFATALLAATLIPVSSEVVLGVLIAAKGAEAAGVQQLFFFHHDPASTDEALDRVGELGRSFFAGAEMASAGRAM